MLAMIGFISIFLIVLVGSCLSGMTVIDFFRGCAILGVLYGICYSVGCAVMFLIRITS